MMLIDALCDAPFSFFPLWSSTSDFFSILVIQFLSPRLCVPGSPDTRVSMGRCTITKQSTQPNLILVTITKLLSRVGDN